MNFQQQSGNSLARQLAFIAALLAWMLLGVGCLTLQITFAGGYATVLRFAAVCAGASVMLLLFAIWRGRTSTRALALAGLAPLVYIAIDVLGRI